MFNVEMTYSYFMRNRYFSTHKVCAISWSHWAFFGTITHDSMNFQLIGDVVVIPSDVVEQFTGDEGIAWDLFYGNGLLESYGKRDLL